MPPNADDLLSHGYQLHIKPLPAGDVACIKPLVDKSNLKLAEEPEKDLLIIYRPMNQP
jgi:hypothetical protein